MLTSALTGAGATAVATFPAATEHQSAAAATTAKLRLTRGRDVWMSAQATQTSTKTWAARVRSEHRITSGRYKLRVKFSTLFGDVVERYVARIRRVR